MADFVKSGYGQVEPNHLSGQRTGQIYAQLPAADAIDVLENGTFVKYNYPDEVVDFVGEGEWMLVFNEIKLYDVRQFAKDFAMKKVDAGDGEIVPRVYKTNVGDIFTTNMIDDDTVVVGDILVPGRDGVLELGTAGDGGMQWQVVAVTTMPDGEPAVKVMRLPDAVVADV
jgi:hypothetical protein